MILHSTPGRRRGAFTLIEIMISVTLLGLVLGSLALMSSAGDRAFQTTSVRAGLEAQSVATLDRVLHDLRIAADASLAPALGDGAFADSLEYAQVVDIDGAKVVLGAKRRIGFEYEAGEIDDGIDNNGNGLVDEGRVVLTDDVGGPGERRLVLTHNVRELLGNEEPNGLDDNQNGLIDEPGFLIRKQGRTLIIELTLERLDRDRRPLQRTVRSSTNLRN
jgi:prepilin-type N-terminal cleavage/methylation domain-containing protein